jgi:hypothetical protein
MRFISTLVMALLSAATVLTARGACIDCVGSTFPNCRVLEPDTFAIHWSDNATHLTVKMVGSANITDYIALGFSTESMGMVNADIAMMSVRGGRFQLDDMHSTDYAPPILDRVQNKRLLAAELSEGIFSATFVMSARSGDPHDVVLDESRWVYTMWAIGAQGSYHGARRGSTRMAFLRAPEVDDARVPDDAFNITIALPPMPLPTDATTYRCMVMEVPHDRKYHLYGAEMLLDEGAYPGVVHHNDVYQVMGPPPPYPLGVPYDCTADIASNYGYVLYGSARHVFTSPSAKSYETVDAALPVGKGFARYIILEVHLNVVNFVLGYHGVVGFNLTLSPTLRKHDVGIAILGAGTTYPRVNVTSALRIPPGDPNFVYADYCPRRCTQRHLPETAHVLYVHLHAHRLCKSMRVDVVRGGNGTMEPMAVMRRWDLQNQQGMGFWTPGFPIHAGDSFVTRFDYDSSSKENVTVWGPSGVNDEMAFVFLYYYPAITTFGCFDMRNMSSNGLTFLRTHKLLADYGFCAGAMEYANATVPGDPAEFERQVFTNGLMQPIDVDELAQKWRVA